jgi:galactokinase
MPESPLDRAVRVFRKVFSRPPTFAVRAPGRVDVIGAHVDYNDGFVLPAAIDRCVWLAVAPSENLTSLVATDLDERVTLPASGLEMRTDADGCPLPGWALYPAGTAWALQAAGLTTPAMDATIAGNVPIGAGLSSSAALELAFATAWRALGGWETSDRELASLCRKAENEYAGVACGIMDQMASALGRRGHALLVDCRTLACEAVPVPAGCTLVVADTTTRRKLADGSLNRRQDECLEALQILTERIGPRAALRDVSIEELDAHGHALPEPVRSRARHVVEECARVLDVAEAMRRGDAERMGALMNESMLSSRDLFDISGDALESMWSAGTGHDGCLGGRLVGAGFAGCTVFLVRTAAATDFVEDTGRRFEAATGIAPHLYVAETADGAGVVELA